jgi:hypothetical protein
MHPCCLVGVCADGGWSSIGAPQSLALTRCSLGCQALGAKTQRGRGKLERVAHHTLKNNCRDGTEFLYSPQPALPIINIFHSYGTFVTITKPILNTVIVYFETGPHYVAQAGLETRSLSPSAS